MKDFLTWLPLVILLIGVGVPLLMMFYFLWKDDDNQYH